VVAVEDILQQEEEPAPAADLPVKQVMVQAVAAAEHKVLLVLVVLVVEELALQVQEEMAVNSIQELLHHLEAQDLAKAEMVLIMAEMPDPEAAVEDTMEVVKEVVMSQHSAVAEAADT
jgi:16S rRNA C1402 (ribose-2'-O) methylase RsmI